MNSWLNLEWINGRSNQASMKCQNQSYPHSPGIQEYHHIAPCADSRQDRLCCLVPSRRLSPPPVCSAPYSWGSQLRTSPVDTQPSSPFPSSPPPFASRSSRSCCTRLCARFKRPSRRINKRHFLWILVSGAFYLQSLVKSSPSLMSIVYASRRQKVCADFTHSSFF